MLAAAFLCSNILTQSIAPDPPRGFKLASDREIWQLGSPDLDDESYEVTLVKDKVRVETRVEYVAREEKEWKAKPKTEPKHSIFLGHATGHWEIGMGAKVSDGWIHGWDAGEFGGGLYWFSADGSKFKKIGDRNTQIVTKTSKGVFAFQSLNHLMFSYSRFIKVEQVKGLWKEVLVTDLHDCPSAVLFVEGRFLYIGPKYVSTMELDGTQRLIYRSPRQLMPGGFYQRKNGEVWMGSSRSILCLVPEANGQYKHFWFRPTKPAKQALPSHWFPASKLTTSNRSSQCLG